MNFDNTKMSPLIPESVTQFRKRITSFTHFRGTMNEWSKRILFPVIDISLLQVSQIQSPGNRNQLFGMSSF